MDNRSRHRVPPIPRLLLARLLEDPEAAELRAVRARIERNPADRRALTRLLALEDALASPAFDAAYDRTTDGADGSISRELIDRLLAIPDAYAQDQGLSSELLVPRMPSEAVVREPGASPRRNRSATRSRPLALAALVVLSAGVWLLSKYSRPDRHFESAAERDRDGSESQPGLKLPVLSLRLQRHDDPYAIEVDLEEAGASRWRAAVPMDGWIQLRVLRPEHVPGGDRWNARAALSRRDANTGRLTPLELPALHGEGESTALEVRVGPAIVVAELVRLGFRPGDALVFEIWRGSEQLYLEVVLQP